MRKRTISLWVLSPFVLIALLLVLLLSPLGSPVIRYAAVSFVPGLTIDNIDGSVYGDMTVDDLVWQDASWKVEVGSATVNLSWRCLMAPKVCIEKLAASDITVTQLGVSEDTEADDAPAEPFSLPVAVRLDNARIRQLRVELAEQSVAVKQITLAARAKDEIVINDPVIEGLTVRLPAASEPQTQTPTSYSLSYSAPQLPEVRLPVAITINQFALKNTTLYQGESPQAIPAVTFDKLVFKDTHLDIDTLDVEHESASLRADADVTFENDYPLNLQANAAISLDENTRQKLDLSASGSLSDLTLELDATNAYDIQARVHANILSDTLPLDISANWDEQPLPMQAQGTLHEGDIVLSGTMGDYTLTGSSAATLPDIGRVPVNVDVVLNRKNVRVNDITVALLEGKITNTGTLYLNESVSWNGKTRVSGISTADLVPQGPTNITGGFTSLMQLTDKGPEMSISELAFSGTVEERPINVSGSVVYASGSDIIVGTLAVTQDTNTVNVAGQIFNKRYLDATVRLDLPDMKTLYPGIAGSAKGDIRATGDWQNPSAKGDVTFADVQVSPSINSTLAAQGPLNGTFGVDGALARHELELDVTVPEHSAKISLTGQWENNQWQGKFTNSELGILNTRWKLDSPFTVTLVPEPLSATVSSHCWQSRAEGSLCIENVLYKEEKAQWTVNANALPLGIWANELAPAIVPDAPDATLSVNTRGQVGANTPMSATFSANITPAAWTLGEERPITITLSKVNTTGTFKDGVLQATSQFVSDELGEASLSVTTTPLEDTPTLDGNIQFTGINVSPLQPLSPAIRQLSGKLNGDITLGGTLDSPSLNGSLALEGGALDVEDMPVSLSNWQQSVTLTGQQAEFDGTFKLGDGEGSLSGSANWSGDPEFTARLKGKRFEVRQRDIRMQVSPDLTAEVSKEKIDVSGSVNIPWARIVIEELPENAVSPSKDVHLRGEPPSDDPLDIIHASVMVNIDKARSGEVKLEAFGLTANLHGGIRVNTQPSLVGYGDLQILDGRYEAYGQNLVIQTGEVQFNGPIDQPMLLVEAIRDPAKTNDGVIAGIRIDGPTDSPNVNLFSEPAMDQQYVLSYLLTGEGPNTERQSPNYNALLLGFGLSNTKGLTGQIGDTLGIEDLSLSASESGVSVSGQLTDRLSVQYNVEVDAIQSESTNGNLRRRQRPPDLTVRYKLLPKLFLEAVQTTIEDESEYALDLYYQFFLGENKQDEEEDDGEDED